MAGGGVSSQAPGPSQPTDTVHVIHARAGVPDVHKMQIRATVRVARPGAEAEVLTGQFSALPSGLVLNRSRIVLTGHLGTDGPL